MGFEGLALALAAFLAAARGKERRRYIYDQLEYAFDASKTMGEEGEAKERRRKVNSFPFLLPFPSPLSSCSLYRSLLRRKYTSAKPGLTSSLPPLLRIFLILLVLFLISLTPPGLLPPIINVSTSIVVLDKVVPLKSILDEILVLILVHCIVQILIVLLTLERKNEDAFSSKGEGEGERGAREGRGEGKRTFHWLDLPPPARAAFS